jgi:hypothetical protein
VDHQPQGGGPRPAQNTRASPARQGTQGPETTTQAGGERPNAARPRQRPGTGRRGNPGDPRRSPETPQARSTRTRAEEGGRRPGERPGAPEGPGQSQARRGHPGTQGTQGQGAQSPTRFDDSLALASVFKERDNNNSIPCSVATLASIIDSRLHATSMMLI